MILAILLMTGVVLNTILIIFIAKELNRRITAIKDYLKDEIILRENLKTRCTTDINRIYQRLKHISSFTATINNDMQRHILKKSNNSLKCYLLIKRTQRELTHLMEGIYGVDTETENKQRKKRV